MIRTEQRRRTRDAIIISAVAVFAEHGFQAASTRDIAGRANLTQGLLTYHFATKDELWKAAADRIFLELREEVLTPPRPTEKVAPRDRARQAIVRYVRFVACHPELFRFMVDEGNTDSERMRWLISEHLRPLFDGVRQLASTIQPSPLDLTPDTLDSVHLYYVLAGAGSLIFAVAPECRALTGVDPTETSVIDRHADIVARLLVP